MAIVMLPHNPVSEGARDVARNMGISRIKRENSTYKHRKENTIINWGCPVRPPHISEDAMVFNSFEAVAKASNKITAFKAFEDEGVPCPPFTTDKADAYDWMEQGKTVVVRTILNGHGGKGIEIYDPSFMDDPDWVLPEAPLYTQYVPKKSEYRVHVMDGRIIDVTRKTLREDYPDKENVNWKVRNLDNGFIFSRFNNRVLNMDGSPKEEIEILNPIIKREAVRAVNALGLDFGAVDIIWNSKHQRAYVLEVNTAPGVADTAADRYANSFYSLVKDKARAQERKERAMYQNKIRYENGQFIFPEDFANPDGGAIPAPRIVENENGDAVIEF